MTNEQEIRRIVREEIRAAFEAMYQEAEWGTSAEAVAEVLRSRFGRCTAKVNNGYDRCEHDAGTCPEHDTPRPGIHCTVCEHAPHGSGTCIGNRNLCPCTGQPAERLCSGCGNGENRHIEGYWCRKFMWTGPDAPVPFTVTTLGARFQDVPPAVHKDGRADPDSVWADTSSWPVCIGCGHGKHSHGPKGCTRLGPSKCACPVLGSAQ